MKNYFLTVVLFFISFSLFSQNRTIYGGLGLGLHYGGFGGNLSITPDKYFGFDLGVGYNLAGLGVDAGTSIRILPDKKVCPDIGFLYGYNTVVIVKNLRELDKIFYGPSITAGFKAYNPKRSNYFNFQVIYPFRSKSYEAYIKNLVLESKPSPVLFSMGYNFAF